jgi:anaerobic selenocysteine-containing dehydrogenase
MEMAREVRVENKDYTLVPHKNPFRYTEGEYTVTRSVAWSGPGCHDGCGVLLYTNKEGRLVKCEGDPENPFNAGRLCMRCLALPDVTHHPERLLYPMRRDRQNRGKDIWERISWDEAYDLIYQEFNKIIALYGAETIFTAHGTGRDIATYIVRLCKTFGSPNDTFPLAGISCYLPRVVGCFAITGNFWVADCAQQFVDRYENPEYQLPETMFIWGNYPLKSNSDGLYGHWIIDMMKRGMHIVMIDPRVTWLSGKAMEHLRIRPGTDTALALAMLNVIINEDLYDHDFVERWCFGFAELKDHIQKYTPSWASAITWLPEEQIIRVARILAASNNATLQWGLAIDMTREATPCNQAVLMLFCITGNLDVPGGLIVPPEILNYLAGDIGGFDLSPEQWAKRIGPDRYGIFNYGPQILHPDCWAETLHTEKPYKLRGAWLQTSNVIACAGAQPRYTCEGLQELDFVVVVDLFKTPTIMAAADVVLPAATFPERNGIRIGDGAQRGETINKAMEPLGEVRSDMDIDLQIGRMFNREAWPWENSEAMYSEILACTGYSFEQLQEAAPAYMPFEYRRYEKGMLRKDGQLGFNTPTGRIELWSNFYKQCGIDPLPYFEEPVPSPVSTPELFERYPLILTTGARDWASFHSEHRQVRRLRAFKPTPTVEVNPKTLEELGLADGDWVWLENHLGRAKRRVLATPVIDERMVASDHAWWYPEGDPEKLYDVFDLNINELMPWSPGKSGFGANYKNSLCRIYRVKETEEE